jgi:hypothetical protein
MTTMKISFPSFFVLFSLSLGVALGGENEGPIALEKGDYKAAVKEFSALAEKGDTKAMVQVGLFYYEGQGVNRDYTKAMDWFLKAFKGQNADAFVNLGVMHRDGQSVPANKKVAYCVFLTTHMCGLGSEATQSRANSCLRRIVEELPKDEIKDCLSNYTLQYITAYVEAKGVMQGIPEKYRPSKESPALKDLDWWMEGELDPIYGPPTEEEKKARKEREEQRQKDFEALGHTLITQIKVTHSDKNVYPSYELITSSGMSKSPISENKASETNHETIYEIRPNIYLDQQRYIALEEKDKKYVLIYEIKHPAKPEPKDWSEWLKPSFTLKDSMDTFFLCKGQKPKSQSTDIPPNAPLIRFKVTKE